MAADGELYRPPRFSETSEVLSLYATCATLAWAGRRGILHADHLGSASLTTDASGNRAGELRYKPYGDTRYAIGAFPTDRRYTGQVEDAATGLYFYNARYYDPLLARFISADTIVPSPSSPQSLNRYSYCLGNPLRYADPTGHWVWIPILAAGGAILTTVTYLATTPASERNVGDALLVAGAGAVGGALIGTGIGIVAGTVLAGATAAASTATAATVVSGLTGAGLGTVVSAESYLASNARSGESFDRIDFAVGTVSGMMEGGCTAIVPSGTFAPFARIGLSGAFAAAESAVGDVWHGDPVDKKAMAGAAGLGIFSGIGGEFISGGLGLPQSSPMVIRDSAPWVDLTLAAVPRDPILARMALAQATRQGPRTAGRDFGMAQNLAKSV